MNRMRLHQEMAHMLLRAGKTNNVARAQTHTKKSFLSPWKPINCELRSVIANNIGTHALNMCQVKIQATFSPSSISNNERVAKTSSTYIRCFQRVCDQAQAHATYSEYLITDQLRMQQKKNIHFFSERKKKSTNCAHATYHVWCDARAARLNAAEWLHSLDYRKQASICRFTFDKILLKFRDITRQLTPYSILQASRLFIQHLCHDLSVEL